MSTDYLSTHSAPTEAAAKPRKRWGKKKIAVVTTAAVVAVGGGTAWAAIALFGFGSFSSDATTASNLTIIGQPTVTSKLAPGKTVGVKGIVRNTNDFAVKVSAIIVKTGSAKTVPANDPECKISLASGGSTVDYPKEDGTTDVAGGGTQYTLATPVEVPAGQDVWVTVPNVLTQAADATKFCGVKADYAVKGAVGN